MRPLRVLTWHVHGNYLWYLSHAPHHFFVPVQPDGRGALGPSFPWGDNMHEVAADEVRHTEFDCVLFQHHDNWLRDQHAILSAAQRRLPRVYLEHDPPRQSPTDTVHPVDDPDVLLVHVTHFNRLMWHAPRTPTTVIEHGVVVPDTIRATGELARGITAINCLARRGRRLGVDVFTELRAELPLDLVGIESAELGGLGEIAPMELPAFVARYRFFFNPIRYTSLGLAVCEAMMLGVPIVGLATTEMVTTIDNEVSGFLSNDLDELRATMRVLLDDPHRARQLGDGARAVARERFSIDRFVRDWDATLRAVTAHGAVQRGGFAAVAR